MAEAVVLSGQSKKRLKKSLNPAYAILSKVLSNKEREIKKLISLLPFDELSSIEVGLNGMTKSFTQNVLKKNMDSVMAEKYYFGDR